MFINVNLTLILVWPTLALGIPKKQLAFQFCFSDEILKKSKYWKMFILSLFSNSNTCIFYRFGSSETTNKNGDGNVLMLESAFNEENQCFYPSETFSSCQIACQNVSTSLTSSNPSLSNFYHMLTEIKEQVQIQWRIGYPKPGFWVLEATPWKNEFKASLTRLFFIFPPEFWYI